MKKQLLKYISISATVALLLPLIACSSGRQNIPAASGEPAPESVAGAQSQGLPASPPADTETDIAGGHPPSTFGSGAIPVSLETTPVDEADGFASTEEPGKRIQRMLDEALNFCEISQDFWQKGELENALDALDQAYALILEVDTGDQPKLLQQKEDLRYLISRRILEIYASRNIVVTGQHNAIPIVINRHVQEEIDRFTVGHERDFFIQSYRRSGRYRPAIVSELRQAGLPEELSWLPLIESGFKVRALSRARALGLWQFIPSTGYKFGLSRDKYVDERLDPQKATLAAIAYMKELHQIFGDWTTVLAAYNCGEGRVLRVIREQNLQYLDNFWDLYERLPYETARYVPRFLATLHILENKEKYGMEDIEVDPVYEFEEFEITQAGPFEACSQCHRGFRKGTGGSESGTALPDSPAGTLHAANPFRKNPGLDRRAERRPGLPAAHPGIRMASRAPGRDAFDHRAQISHLCPQHYARQQSAQFALHRCRPPAENPTARLPVFDQQLQAEHRLQ